MQLYISRNGQQTGPFEIEAVRQMLQTGQLSPDDLGFRQGGAQWEPLGRMLGASAPIRTPPQPAPVAASVNQPPATKSGSSKGCLFAVLGLGAFVLIALAAIVGIFALRNRTTVSTDPPADSAPRPNNPVPVDFTALKDKAEDLAALQPTLKLDPKAKLKGRIAIVQKGKSAAELQGFDAYFKSVSETALVPYKLTTGMIARTPEEIDSLVQIICTKGKSVARYEGNIVGYANNCKVSLIDYRTKTAFAQKTLVNAKADKSVSSVYDGGDYILLPPTAEIADYVASFAPDSIEVRSGDTSAIPNIEDPKVLVFSGQNFANLAFPMKTDGTGAIKGKTMTVQTSAGSSTATVVGLDSDGNIQKPLPDAIILTKEGLGFSDDRIARKSSEIDTLIQVNCKKGALITKVKGISVFTNVCTVSVVDYKGFATIGQKTFEGKTINNERYSDPSMYNDKQDTVDFPRAEIEEYIKSFPKS